MLMRHIRALWRRQPVRWAALVAWMGAIFVLSAQSTFPAAVQWLPEWRDVLAHFAVYLLLGWLWHQVLSGAGVRRAGWWAFALTVLYGLSDEFHQAFVPGRHPDIFDVLTDAAGAGAAQWLAHRASTGAPGADPIPRRRFLRRALRRPPAQ